MAADDFESLHVVRKIRQTVRKWWSVELAYADAGGKVAGHENGVVIPPHNPICQSILRSRDGFQRCNRSVEQALVRIGQKPSAPASCGPCHLGLDIVAAPVVSKGRFMGAVFACGFLANGGAARSTEVVAKSKALGVQRDEVLVEGRLASLGGGLIVDITGSVPQPERPVSVLVAPNLAGRFDAGLLRGLPVEVLERVAQTLPLTEGAERLIANVRRLGYKIAILSGGFRFFAERLQARLRSEIGRAHV